ncbi:hypothetical protein, partial [Actinomadura sp. BRA 177]|uniref:hypothetical protein n=1 Tax=Actinomadura sp. BRA 177 TaxID=2745202 RepID=UPI001C3DC201
MGVMVPDRASGGCGLGYGVGYDCFYVVGSGVGVALVVGAVASVQESAQEVGCGGQIAGAGQGRGQVVEEGRYDLYPA